MIRRVSKAICITIPLAMILAGCGDRRKGTATPEAAAQYEEVVQACDDSRENEWMQEDAREREIAALIGHFDRTADASYATPNLKLTMLHLACLFKKPELARCLLRDGADANARCVNGIQEPAETPLIYAVSTVLTTEVPTATCTELIDVLIAGGAKPELSEWHGNSLLMVATYLCDQEEIVKHLLRYIRSRQRKTWKPSCSEAGTAPWSKYSANAPLCKGRSINYCTPHATTYPAPVLTPKFDVPSFYCKREQTFTQRMSEG